jgi:hypothetical protein
MIIVGETKEATMLTQIINFPNQQALCAFPEGHSNLERAISELQLDENYPVIVLIGGDIDQEQAVVTQQAIQTISRIAEDTGAVEMTTRRKVWLDEGWTSSDKEVEKSDEGCLSTLICFSPNLYGDLQHLKCCKSP